MTHTDVIKCKNNCNTGSNNSNATTYNNDSNNNNNNNNNNDNNNNLYKWMHCPLTPTEH